MQEFAVSPLQGMMQIMLWNGLLNRTIFFQIIYLNFIMKIVLILF